MAALEVLALDEATPQIVAPQSGDTYSLPRSAAMAAGATFGWSTDTILKRNAAGVLDLSNGTNPTGLLINNTTDGGSNYERFKLWWNSNVMTLSGEASGAGSTTRNMEIYPGLLTNAGIKFTNNSTASVVDYYTRTVHNFYEDADLKFSIGKNNIYPNHASGNVALGLNSAGGGWKGVVGQELSADPSDPAEGMHVLWQSDGTGSGDDGDILIKITAGGVTKTVTLVDFSAF